MSDQSPFAQQPKSKRTLSPVVIIILIFSGLIVAMPIVCCSGVLILPYLPVNNSPRKASNSQAIMAAMREVRSILKFPDDSDFGFLPPSAKKIKEGTLVVGKVKAKNSFGAELTHSWRCLMVRRNGAWEADIIILDGKTIYSAD